MQPGVFGQVAWVTISRILSRGSLLLASIIMAKALDVQGFASFSYFVLTVNMLATYASMGLGVTANRYFVDADKPDAEQSRTIAAMVSMSVLFSVILAFAVFLVPKTVLVGDLPVPRWAMVFGVFAFSLETIPQNALNGLEKYRFDAILSVFSGGAVVGMAVYAAAIQSLELAMIGLIGGSLVRVFGGAAIVMHTVGWRKFAVGFPFSINDAIRVFSFSLPMFLGALLVSTGPWAVGRIILSGNGGSYALALFAIGLQWFSLGMFLPASISRITVPRLVRSINAPTTSDPVKKHVMLGMSLSLASSGAVALSGLLFSPQIMALYGSNYSADVWFLGAFLLVAILAAAGQMMGILIVMSNRQWAWLRINMGFLATLVLSALLFAEQGAWAGPISYLIAYSMVLGLAILFVRSKGLMRDNIGDDAARKV
jgi:O-antigen/teichoic acid export membrane protein